MGFFWGNDLGELWRKRLVLVTKHSNDKNMVTKSVGKIASNVNEVKLIIIGSSNAYRFLEHLDKQLQDIITMQKCSKAEPG